MTLTVEVAPEVRATLESEAARQGQSMAAYVAALLAQAAEDAGDAAECERARAEVGAEDLIPWEKLKAEAGL